MKSEFRMKEGIPEIIRLPALDFNDDKGCKPLSFNKFIGRLDKGLDEEAERSWTVIDMKNDWLVIYPFELSETDI